MQKITFCYEKVHYFMLDLIRGYRSLISKSSSVGSSGNINVRYLYSVVLNKGQE